MRPVRLLATTAIGLATVIGAPVSHAQVVSAVDVGTRADRPGGGAADWRNAIVIAPALRFDNRWLAIDGIGRLVATDGASATGEGAASASLYSPVRVGFRLALGAQASRARLDDGLPLASGSAGARLSYARQAWGLWAGRDVATDSRETSLPIVPDVTFGGWRQIGRAIVTLNVGSSQAHSGARAPVFRHTHPGFPDDSVFGDSASNGTLHAWTDAEAGVSWAFGRLAIDGTVGARIRTANERGGSWGHVETTWSLSPHAALVAGGGVRPRAVAYGTDAAPFLNLGLRLAPTALLRPRLPIGVRPSAAAFALRSAGPGRYVVRVRVPNARSVELSGDFSRWTPVSLARASNAADTWEATIAIPAGTHHVAIRVDGDRWMPPPGTSVADDEFGGRVGVVVVN